MKQMRANPHTTEFIAQNMVNVKLTGTDCYDVDGFGGFYERRAAMAAPYAAPCSPMAAPYGLQSDNGKFAMRN